MLNGLGIRFEFQTAFGGIGHGIGAVNQAMVPGLVFVGLGVIGLVPGFVGVAKIVERDDYGAVIVALVANQLAGPKACHLFCWCNHED